MACKFVWKPLFFGQTPPLRVPITVHATADSVLSSYMGTCTAYLASIVFGDALCKPLFFASGPAQWHSSLGHFWTDVNKLLSLIMDLSPSLALRIQATSWAQTCHPEICLQSLQWWLLQCCHREIGINKKAYVTTGTARTLPERCVLLYCCCMSGVHC